MSESKQYIDIVFDGPPSHESGRFVEVENEQGKSIRFGEWVERKDGYWALRIESIDALKARNAELVTALTEIAEYVAINEMTIAPQLPVAPLEMKKIALAALAIEKEKAHVETN